MHSVRWYFPFGETGIPVKDRESNSNVFCSKNDWVWWLWREFQCLCSVSFCLPLHSRKKHSNVLFHQPTITLSSNPPFSQPVFHIIFSRSLTYDPRISSIFLYQGLTLTFQLTSHIAGNILDAMTISTIYQLDGIILKTTWPYCLQICF